MSKGVGSWVGRILLVILGLGALAAVVNVWSAAKRTGSSAAAVAFPPVPTAAGTRTFDFDAGYSSLWTYEDRADKLRGTTERYAHLEALNVNGHMQIQKTSDGTAVLLVLDRAQFVCPGDGCNVSVRFDSGPVEQVWCQHPADGETRAVFLGSGGALVPKLKRAHHVIIEAELFQAGAVQIEFAPLGLAWP